MTYFTKFIAIYHQYLIFADVSSCVISEDNIHAAMFQSNLLHKLQWTVNPFGKINMWKKCLQCVLVNNYVVHKILKLFSHMPFFSAKQDEFCFQLLTAPSIGFYQKSSWSLVHRDSLEGVDI